MGKPEKETKITLGKEIAIQAINAFFSPIMVKDKKQIDKIEHRYRSWEICWEKFKGISPKQLKKKQDELALNLGFYLASWGMYRGSSFLLQRNYITHLKPVEHLVNDLHSIQKDTSAEDICDVLFGKDNQSGLRKKLLEDYGVDYQESTEDEDDEIHGKMSDTLFSKIVLGVNGCIPAFDRYYKCGVSHFGGTQKLGRKSIIEIYNYWNSKDEKGENKFDGAFSDIVTYPRKNPYPPMKLMDMCFFTIGMGIDLNNACFDALKEKDNNEKKLLTAINKYYDFIKGLDTDFIKNLDKYGNKNFLTIVLELAIADNTKKAQENNRTKYYFEETENHFPSADIVGDDIIFSKGKDDIKNSKRYKYFNEEVELKNK